MNTGLPSVILRGPYNTKAPLAVARFGFFDFFRLRKQLTMVGVVYWITFGDPSGGPYNTKAPLAVARFGFFDFFRLRKQVFDAEEIKKATPFHGAAFVLWEILDSNQ